MYPNRVYIEISHSIFFCWCALPNIVVSSKGDKRDPPKEQTDLLVVATSHQVNVYSTEFLILFFRRCACCGRVLAVYTLLLLFFFSLPDRLHNTQQNSWLHHHEFLNVYSEPFIGCCCCCCCIIFHHYGTIWVN